MEIAFLLIGIGIGFGVSTIVLLIKGKEEQKTIEKFCRAKKVAERELLRERKINDLLMEVNNGK